MTHKYAPSTVIKHTPRGFFCAPVQQYIAHPPSAQRRACPIRKDMYAVEMVTALGSRWQGCERAYINSELRMVLVFRDLRDEVIARRWEDVPAELQEEGK